MLLQTSLDEKASGGQRGVAPLHSPPGVTPWTPVPVTRYPLRPQSAISPYPDDQAGGATHLHRLIPASLATFLASGFGIGFVPFAPGTFGSVLGVALAGLLLKSGLPLAWYAALAMAVFLFGIPCTRRAAEVQGVKDPGWIVLDEIAAVLFIYTVIPFTWTTAVLGFLLFRLFDVSKPYPLRWLERLPHGWGIMADDVAAGFYTGLLMAIARHYGWLSV